VILIDTSAWIEFLRGTGSGVCDRVDAALSEETATCDPIMMEVLAGARDESNLADLRRLLARSSVLPTLPRHYEAAAGIFRAGRRQGLTIRRLNDCLIAAVAIDYGASLLHADRDFAAIAEVTELRVGS